MIRKSDIGKTLFFTRYDPKELPGFRYGIGKLTIADASINGLFLVAETGTWLPQGFIDSERLFWRSWECEEYCKKRNAEDFQEEVENARYGRVS